MAKKKKADLDDGFTMISNTLLEALYERPLSGREIQVILYIIRKSYGYHDKECCKASRCIEEESGIKSNHIAEIIQKLVKNKIIKQAVKLGGKPQKLSVNTQISEWLIAPRNEKLTPVDGSEQTPVDGSPVEGSKQTPVYGSEQTPVDGTNLNIIYKETNQIKCVGENGKSRFPVTQIFDRLWSEWSFSQAGKDRVPRKVRTEIEGIGYARMNDARKRYEEDLRTRPTKNNQPLSARTWFTGGYIQFLPKVEDNGLWRSIEGKAYFREERLD